MPRKPACLGTAAITRSWGKLLAAVNDLQPLARQHPGHSILQLQRNECFKTLDYEMKAHMKYEHENRSFSV